ncbi:MAG: glycosyltransferase [Bacteroidales bacterium]
MSFEKLFMPLDWALMISFFCFFSIQLCFYFTLYRRFIVICKRAKKGVLNYTDEQQPVSVIVYACNDAENLELYLPQILNQNYPKYEVIVVNDGSTDDTKDLLTILETKHPHLYQTYIPEEAKNHSRRKLAMTVGLKAAKYDWILTTEANCEVKSADWIASVARNFTPETEVVLMYSTFEYPRSLKSVFRSLDNLFFSIRYLGMASFGKPFMGIRRNLAYRKELFFRNGGGYSGFLNLRDGDDDLFINRIANKNNTRVEISSESVTRAHFYQFDKAWRNQKQAYGITSNFLKGRPSFLFGFESLTRYIFYANFILLLYFGLDNYILWLVAAFLYLSRWILQAVIINSSGKIVGEKSHLFSLIIYDIVQPIIDLKYRLAGRFAKRR